MVKRNIWFGLIIGLMVTSTFSNASQRKNVPLEYKEFVQLSNELNAAFSDETYDEEKGLLSCKLGEGQGNKFMNSGSSSNLTLDKRLLLSLQRLPKIFHVVGKTNPELTMDNHKKFGRYVTFILIGQRIMPFLALPGFAMGAYDLYKYISMSNY